MDNNNNEGGGGDAATTTMDPIEEVTRSVAASLNRKASNYAMIQMEWDVLRRDLATSVAESNKCKAKRKRLLPELEGARLALQWREGVTDAARVAALAKCVCHLETWA